MRNTTPAAALIAANDETISWLDAEVAYLRDRLDHGRRELSAERERVEVVHREALQRIEAVTVGDLRAGDTDHDQRTASTADQARRSPRIDPDASPKVAVVTSWVRGRFGRSG